MTEFVQSSQNNQNNLLVQPPQPAQVQIHNSELEPDELDAIANSLDGRLETSRSSCWLDLDHIPNLTEAITRATFAEGVAEEFLEKLLVVKYHKDDIHNDHHDAFDLQTPRGNARAGKRGQRLSTTTLVLRGSIEFSNLVTKASLDSGQLIRYNNLGSDLRRNPDMIKRYLVTSDTILVHLYVREKVRNSQGVQGRTDVLPKEIVRSELTQELSGAPPIPSTSNREALDNTYEAFKTNNIPRAGLAPLVFNNKHDWGYVCDLIKSFDEIRNTNNSTLLCGTKYENAAEMQFDEYTPAVIESVFCEQAIGLVQKFLKDSIEAGTFSLGDRQAQRYRSHNETVCRILHYELAPLIERIVQHPVEPTYTYLSCYVEGTDLPPHTDRADCEYTVSLLVDKPTGAKWPIHLDKTKQPKKHVGRYETTPPLENCIEIDCEPGGMMMFSGVDHIHFRQKLDAEYYRIILLHYRKI